MRWVAVQIQVGATGPPVDLDEAISLLLASVGVTDPTRVEVEERDRIQGVVTDRIRVVEAVTDRCPMAALGAVRVEPVLLVSAEIETPVDREGNAEATHRHAVIHRKKSRFSVILA